MDLDAEVTTIFLKYRGRVIRHLSKHQDINLDYWYYDETSGKEFDVRDFPDAFFEGQPARVTDPHKHAIRRAIDADWKLFKTVTTSQRSSSRSTQ